MTIDKERLRVLAEAATGWSNCDKVWPHAEYDGISVLGAICEEGVQYPVAEIDADTYGDDGDSLKLAQFYAGANPAAVLALLAENAALAAEVERLRKDHAAALGLVADVRFALGDNGKRMQPELIEWTTGLRRDAERYQWLRDAYNRPTDDVDEDGFSVVGGIARIMVVTDRYGERTGFALEELDAAIDAAKGGTQ